MVAGDWVASNCTEALLKSYQAAGLLVKGRYRVPPAIESTPSPRNGEFIVFTSQLERGLGFPTSKFFRRFLAFYAIKLSDLGPHSIEQITIFMAFYECYLGREPYIPLCRHRRKQKKDGALRGNGGITF